MLSVSEGLLRIAVAEATKLAQAELQPCNSTHNVDKGCGDLDYPQQKTLYLVGTLTRAINGR
jgi:hypothetical protein